MKCCEEDIHILVTGHTENAIKGCIMDGHPHQYTAFCPTCKYKLVIPVDNPYQFAQSNKDSEVIFSLLFKEEE